VENLWKTHRKAVDNFLTSKKQKGVFHRFSTSFPQVFHRFSTGFPQVFHNIFIILSICKKERDLYRDARASRARVAGGF